MNRKKSHKKNVKKYVCMSITTFMCVMIVMGMMKIKVSGNEKINLSSSQETVSEIVISAESYEEYESLYVKDIKSVLTNQLLSNSGINMTKVLCDNGKREYNIAIYHDQIQKMTNKQREALKARLEQVSFADGACSVQVEFIEL